MDRRGNGPNPGIGQFRSGSCGESPKWLGGLCALGSFAGALQFSERFERFEEFARDRRVVAHVHLPVLGGHGHEADGDGAVRVEVLGAILDELPRAAALDIGGGVEDFRLEATRAQAAPVSVGKPQDESVFGGVAWLERVAEAPENAGILVLVFFGEDDESGRG
ncbi:MAG TPA: hypothetical protein VF182_02610 [Candidatus Binatia bacterium]